MKKFYIASVALLLLLTLAGCSNLGLNDSSDQGSKLSSQQALSSLAYLSASMLSVEASSEDNVSREFVFLSNHSETSTEIEQELEDVNIYLDKLKVFMDQGPDAFASVQTTGSDREEYEFMINAGVEESTYLIYYNVDPDTNELSGIIVVDNVEYVIAVENTLEDKYELEIETDVDDEDDDDEDDIDDEDVDLDIEQKITLVAFNGDDSIEVEYKYELEEDKMTTKFEMEKSIAGEETEILIKILQENDEYKVEIEEGDNHYEFKQETEDGETVFKLEYEVNGVTGDIKIIMTTTEDGETVYRYRIEEDGQDIVEVDLLDPDDDDE